MSERTQTAKDYLGRLKNCCEFIRTCWHEVDELATLQQQLLSAQNRGTGDYTVSINKLQNMIDTTIKEIELLEKLVNHV